ncbi:hypothetical protein RUM44_002292 [Polyplax serrata]|uniref:Uncharacterized protein n=1 Tax=Polyplax serrata TaxID=468196 RepID=A0ABR1AMG7_POLSC
MTKREKQEKKAYALKTWQKWQSGTETGRTFTDSEDMDDGRMQDESRIKIINRVSAATVKVNDPPKNPTPGLPGLPGSTKSKFIFMVQVLQMVKSLRFSGFA